MVKYNSNSHEMTKQKGEFHIMEQIKYGKGEKLETREDALTYAYAELIPKVLKDSGKKIEQAPEVIDGRQAGTMLVKVFH